jgi:hypothetical protein
MSRKLFIVLAEGITITSIVVSFLASTAAIVHPAPMTNSARQLQGLQPQRLTPQTLQEFLSVGGEAQSLSPRATNRLQNQQGIEQFFPAAPSRTFYPGTISPLPQDVFQQDQFPHAIKLFETKI